MNRFENIEALNQLLIERRVPEEKIKDAISKVRKYDKEVEKLQIKVITAGDARTANIAIKKARKIRRQVDELIANLIEDAKSENMSNNRKGKGK